MTLNTYTYFKPTPMNDNTKNVTSKFNPITSSSSVNGLPSEEIKMFAGHDKNISRSSSLNVVGSISRSDAISRKDVISAASSGFLMNENDNHWVPISKWNSHLTPAYVPMNTFENNNGNNSILDNVSVTSSSNSIMGLNNNSETNSNSKMNMNMNTNNNPLFPPNINNPLLDLNRSNSVTEGSPSINGNATTNQVFLNNQQTSPLNGSNSQSFNFNLPLYSRDREFNMMPSFPYHHPSNASSNNSYYSDITRNNSIPLSTTNFPTPPASPHSNINFGNGLYYLKNDLDLLIYTSQQKFNEINNFITQNNIKGELTDDLILIANQQLFLKGWYYHTDSLIKKMKTRLQNIFVFQDFGDDSINYSETGNLEFILYTFNLHIGICSDMRNEIQMGKPITLSNASTWWLSAKSLLYQIYNTFKLQNSFINKSNSQTYNMSNINGINRIPSTKRDDIIDIYGMKNKDEIINNGSSGIVMNKDDINPKDINSIGRSNSCMPSLSSPASPNGSNNGPIQPSTNIYIRNLSSTTTDDSLYQMCKQYGTIVSAKAMVDIRTNECKGFGFVMYETEEEARKAIDALNKLKYYVSFARSGTPSSQESYSSRLKNLEDSTSMNIYISNLPVDVDEKQLLNLFKPHKVLSHRILRNEDGVSRGVGFARFNTRAAAQSVIDTYNNTMLPNSDHPLQVRFADSVAQKRLKSQIAIVNGNRHRNGSISGSDITKHVPSPQQQPQLGQPIINQLNLMK